MRWNHLVAAIALGALAAAAVAAPQEGKAPEFTPEQQAMMEAWTKAMAVGPPHAELAKRAGSFEMTISMWMDPTAEPMLSKGTAKRTMTLGGRVLEEKIESSMMGQSFEGLGRTGFDNVSGEYWSTWTDSMSTALFVSRGSRDAEAGTTTFKGEFEDPTTGGKTEARAVVHDENNGEDLFEWYEDRGDGEMKTMEIRYKRIGG